MKTLALLPLLFVCIAAAPATQPLPARLGVNIHFTKPQPGEVKMMADAGVNIVRMDFAWAGTEREKGKYDFSAYDGLMAALEEHQIGAVFILDYSNKFYDDGLSPHTDAGRDAFAKWAAAAVTHFKGRDIVWEMYNEPNIQFWKPNPHVDEYAKLAIATGKAIRAAEPNTKYVGPASSTIDLQFLESCFKAGCLEYWDAVSVHPYRQSNPETVSNEYRELRHLIAKYAPAGKQIPIYSGEWGYSSAWNKYEEEKQALYLPRQWLTNILNDVPLSIWYDWHDDGRDPKEAEHHFGTVQNEKNKDGPEPWKPKPAYQAMKTFGEQLRGFEFNKRLVCEGSPDEDFVLLFARKNVVGQVVETCLVVWTTAAPHELKLYEIAGKFRAWDHLGKELPELEAKMGKLGVELVVPASGSVHYLKPREDNPSLRVAAAIERAPLEISGSSQEPVMTELAFQNPLDHPLKIRKAPGWIDVAPGQVCRVPCGGLVSRLNVQNWLPVEIEVQGVGTIGQWTEVTVTDALLLRVAGSTANKLIVYAEDVSAAGLDIDLTADIDGVEKAAVTKLQIPKGGRKATVQLDANCPLRQTRTIRLGVQETTKVAPNTLLVNQSPGVSEATVLLDRFDPAGMNYRVVADGDKKVKAEQSLGVSAPQEGPLSKGIESLQLAYRFEPGHKFLQVMPTKDELRSLPGKPRELRVWVFGDASGHLARCRVIDSTGETFQPNGTKITWTGWKLVTFPLVANECGHWGGKNDGEIHYPLKLDTLFLLDKVSKKASEGKIYIASPMTVE